MNDLESALIATLQAEADRTSLTVDTAAGLQRLEASFDRIDRDRHHQMIWRTVLAAAAAVLVVASVLLANHLPHGNSSPAGPPTPEVTRPAEPVRQFVAPQPFLYPYELSKALHWYVIPRPDTAPPRLSHCISDPRSWGAVKTQAATYIDPEPAAHHPHLPGRFRLNEYVLQYTDASSAHRAFLAAFGQLKSCPNPPHTHPYPDPLRIFNNLPTKGETFWQQRQASSAATNAPCSGNGCDGLYFLGVTRAGNVLLVVENTNLPSERVAFDAMSDAYHLATPRYKPGR